MLVVYYFEVQKVVLLTRFELWILVGCWINMYIVIVLLFISLAALISVEFYQKRKFDK